MRLKNNDYIVGSAVIPKDYTQSEAKVITITEGGYGKRCEIDEYTPQNRGGKGLICHRLNKKTGRLAGISIVGPDDDIMLITNSGIIIRTKVSEIPVYGRNASGVIVMRMNEEAAIVGFAQVKEDQENLDEENKDTNDIDNNEDAKKAEENNENE